MKNLTIVPLYGPWAKFAGLFIAVTMGLVWVFGLTPFDVSYVKWVVVLGLSLAASARQRNETEKVQAMRYLAYKASFFLLTSLVISGALIEWLHGPAFSDLLLIAGTGLAFHLALFHSLLRFGPESLNEQNTLQANIRANQRFYKTVVVLLVVTILGMAFLASR